MKEIKQLKGACDGGGGRVLETFPPPDAENATTSLAPGAADAERGFYESPHPAWLVWLSGRMTAYEP